jgi:glycogen(starch) synthase
VTEIVVDGVTGATFPPGDSDALAASLIELLEAPDLARRQGEAGYERLVSTFHVRTNVARTVAIYEDALGSAPATQ